MTRSLGLIALFVLVAGAAAAISTGDDLLVSVREAEIRTAPGFLAPIAARVAYGESVTVLETRSGFARVRVVSSGQEGWLHATAVAEADDLNLAGADRDASTTTTREIALAGRGFSEKVESEYKEQNPELDFSRVDAMEEEVLPYSELGEFLAAIDAEIQEVE